MKAIVPTGECEFPGAVMVHRVLTFEDACHMMCWRAESPSSLFGSPPFASFTTSDRFVSPGAKDVHKTYTYGTDTTVVLFFLLLCVHLPPTTAVCNLLCRKQLLC